MTGDVWLADPAGRRTADRLDRTTGSTGSQGSVWLLHTRTDLVAKIVHDTDPFHLAARMRAMLAAPAGWTRPDGRVAVAWPVATVHRRPDGRLLGYAAPRLGPPAHLPLPMLFSRRVRTRALPGGTWAWWLALAEDLARVVDAGHRQGHVIGDLAPANLFAGAGGHCALVDADGWQLRDGPGGADLLCPFSRPEYTAPEDLDRPPRVRRPSGDAWSLAVVVAQVLYLGFHPFGGVPAGPASGAELLDEVGNVRAQRCWLLGADLRMPPAVAPARLLAPVLRDRLRAAFGAGHDDPERRPRPLDWAAALAHTRRRLVACPRQPLHVYPPESAPCPWCAMVEAGAPDPFPERAP
jgi:DNA-binding helix-hairpin-helix protein with protein kinase domain